MERGYLLQRQAEGIASAKRRGIRFGRPTIKTPENFGELVKQWECGNLPTLEALAQTDLKEATFYRRLKEWRTMKRK